jgi:peptidylprolyl isomerase
MVAPARLGFGPQGIAPPGVSPSDTLVEVFDIVGGYPPGQQASGRPVAAQPDLPRVVQQPGIEPVVQPAHRPAPTALRVGTLLAGDGPQVRPGSTVVVQYTGVLWDSGKPFDSSYRRGGPNGFVLAPRDVPPGWPAALTGVRAGSRMLVAVPAAMNQGFGMTRGGLAVPAGKAVVYVLDVLEVH